MELNSSLDYELETDGILKINQDYNASESFLLSSEQIPELKKYGISFHPQQFYEKPTALILDDTQGVQVVNLQVKLSYFTFKLLSYNSTNDNGAYKRGVFINNGGQGDIYGFVGYDQVSQIYNPFIVKKNFPHQHSCKQKIYQYCVTKLFSILKIGCQVRDIFGFDFITYPDNSIQFALQWALPIPFGAHEQLKQLQIQSLNLFRKLKLHHLDIKRQNIMFSQTLGKLVLIDWGCSQLDGIQESISCSPEIKDQNDWKRTYEEYQRLHHSEKQEKLLKDKIVQFIKAKYQFLNQNQIQKIVNFYDPFIFEETKIQQFQIVEANQEYDEQQEDMYSNQNQFLEQIQSFQQDKFLNKSQSFLFQAEDSLLKTLKPNQIVYKMWNQTNKSGPNYLQSLKNQQQRKIIHQILIKYHIYSGQLNKIDLYKMLIDLNEKDCYQLLSFILNLRWNHQTITLFKQQIKPFLQQKIQKQTSNSITLNFYFPTSGFSNLLYKNNFDYDMNDNWTNLLDNFNDKTIKISNKQKRRKYADKSNIMKRVSFAQNFKTRFSQQQWINFLKGQIGYLHEYTIQEQKRCIEDKFHSISKLEYHMELMEYISFVLSVIHLNIFGHTELKILNERHLMNKIYEQGLDISKAQTILTTVHTFLQIIKKRAKKNEYICKQDLWKLEYAFWILQDYEHQRVTLKILNSLDYVQDMEIMMIKLKYLNTLDYTLKKGNQYTLNSCKEAYNCFDFIKLKQYSKDSIEYKIFQLAFICIELNLALYYNNYQQLLTKIKQSFQIRSNICIVQLDKKNVFFRSSIEQMSSFCNDSILWLCFYFYDQITLNHIFQKLRQSYRISVGSSHFNQKYILRLLLNFQKETSRPTWEVIDKKLSPYSKEVYQKCFYIHSIRQRYIRERQLKQFSQEQIKIIFQKLKKCLMNDQDKLHNQEEFEHQENKLSLASYFLLLTDIYRMKQIPIIGKFDYCIKILKNCIRQLQQIENLSEKVSTKHQKQLYEPINNFAKMVFNELKQSIVKTFPEKFYQYFQADSFDNVQESILLEIQNQQYKDKIFKNSQLYCLALDLVSFVVGKPPYFDRKLQQKMMNLINIFGLIDTQIKINTLYWIIKAKFRNEKTTQERIKVLKQGIQHIEKEKKLRTSKNELHYQLDQQIFTTFNNFCTKQLILYSQIAKISPQTQIEGQNVISFIAIFCKNNFPSFLKFLKESTETNQSFYYRLWICYKKNLIKLESFLNVTLSICKQIWESKDSEQNQTILGNLEQNYLSNFFLKSLIEIFKQIFKVSNQRKIMETKSNQIQNQSEYKLIKQIIYTIKQQRVQNKLISDLLFYTLLEISFQIQKSKTYLCQRNIVSKLRRFTGRTDIIFDYPEKVKVILLNLQPKYHDLLQEQSNSQMTLKNIMQKITKDKLSNVKNTPIKKKVRAKINVYYGNID